MNATRTQDWFSGMEAGCDRLLHPAATGEERGRQRRLLGVLLAGPFLATPAIIQTFLPLSGAAGAVALLCAVFAASWLLAVYVATQGKSRSVEWAALAGAAVLAGALFGFGGGMATPVAALLIVLPIEALWITRSQSAALVGGVATLGAAFAFLFAGDPSVAGAWQWLTPALYGASWIVRRFAAENDVSHIAGQAPVVLPEAAFDAVLARISGTGEVESVSPQARDLLRVEPALLLGSGLFERIHVADRVGFLCAVSDTRSDGAARRCPVRLRLPIGSGGEVAGYQPFEAEILRAGADEQSVVAIIRNGRELADLRDDLRKAEELAGATELAKGRFLATVSHELRTPLNAIIGFSDMLLHREISGDLTPKQSENVTLIRDAGNHLLSVVNAILDVSKIESGSYHINAEPFELQPAVELCRAMLAPQAEAKGVTLSARLPHDLGEVLGDQRAVQQILLNLVSNAIKFTPEGGNISVTALRRDNMVRIFVNDTGIGIAADDLNKLGRPFMQIYNDYTRHFQGTGLGLSLVKGLVKLHGGTMSIESAPGLGTTVAIGLPAAAHDNMNDAAGAGAKPVIEGETGERHGIALRKIA